MFLNILNIKLYYVALLLSALTDWFKYLKYISKPDQSLRSHIIQKPQTPCGAPPQREWDAREAPVGASVCEQAAVPLGGDSDFRGFKFELKGYGGRQREDQTPRGQLLPVPTNLTSTCTIQSSKYSYY